MENQNRERGPKRPWTQKEVILVTASGIVVAFLTWSLIEVTGKALGRLPEILANEDSSK